MTTFEVFALCWLVLLTVICLTTAFSYRATRKIVFLLAERELTRDDFLRSAIQKGPELKVLKGEQRGRSDA